MLVATPVPRQPKQSWIPVPVAEVQTTKPPTVRELLARQAAGETPKEPTPEAPQPTALRSPPAREVSTMETGEQQSITMDVEMQEEPMVPSSGATTDEPMIPTDLECQVKTTETVTPVMEEEEPVGLPSIETRTVKTQRGNYATINTRILDQLGRLEVTEQGSTELMQGASQPKPALGLAEIPGMVEVELDQTAQARQPARRKIKSQLEANRVVTERPREKDTMPQTVTLEMPRVVTMKEVTMRHPQYVQMHQVLQEEVEAKAEKRETEKAS